MVGAGGRLPAATAVTAPAVICSSSSTVAVTPPAVLQQQQQQNHQHLQQLQQQQQQHAPPDYTSVAIEKLLHSIWDTKVNDIMAAINHLGLV